MVASGGAQDGGSEVPMAGMPADQELAVLRGVLEAASERVLITDREGTILYVNPAFERVTGYAKADVIRKNPRILKSGRHSRRFYEEFWSILLEGYPFRSRFLNKKKDGTLYFEDQIISPIKDQQGQITHFISVATDVTDKAAFQKAIRGAKEDLHHIQQVSRDCEERLAGVKQEVDALLKELGRPPKYGT